jgi:hypothetical protein
MASVTTKEFEMPHIERKWLIVLDSGLEERLNILYKRPRIDYRVSEYVYGYIEKNILEPKKITELKYGRYALTIKLRFFLLNKNAKAFKDGVSSEHSTYNTENTIYLTDMYRGELRLGYKTILLTCISSEINENIKPKEYANIVYDMIGAFLETKRYKSITKELMEKYRSEMDYAYIESLRYPAAFVDQRYSMDRESTERKFDPFYHDINVREVYMQHYGEKEEKNYEDGKFGTFILSDDNSKFYNKYKLNKKIISIEIHAETINELKHCMVHLYKIIDNLNEINELSSKIILKREISEDVLNNITIRKMVYYNKIYTRSVYSIPYSEHKLRIKFYIIYDLSEEIKSKNNIDYRGIEVSFDENNIAIDVCMIR